MFGVLYNTVEPADKTVELINSSISLQSDMSLRYTSTTNQSGCSFISCFGVY